MVDVTDDFTSSNFALLQNEAEWSLGLVGIAHYGNAIYGYSTIGGYPFCYWSADSFTADQYSKGLLTNIHGSKPHGVAVHVQPSASQNLYGYVGTTGASQIIEKVSGSTSTILGSLTAFSNNDTIELQAEVSGGTTTLTAFINDVEVNSTTDTSFTSGSPGVVFWGDAGTQYGITTWWGGDLAGGGGPTFVAAWAAGSNIIIGMNK